MSHKIKTLHADEQDRRDQLRLEQQAEAERERATRKAADNAGTRSDDAKPAGDTSTSASGTFATHTPTTDVRQCSPVAVPKPVVEVSVSQVLSPTHEGGYLESQQEVELGPSSMCSSASWKTLYLPTRASVCGSAIFLDSRAVLKQACPVS